MFKKVKTLENNLGNLLILTGYLVVDWAAIAISFSIVFLPSLCMCRPRQLAAMIIEASKCEYYLVLDIGQAITHIGKVRYANYWPNFQSESLSNASAECGNYTNCDCGRNTK